MFTIFSGCPQEPPAVNAPRMNQFPSPMADAIRTHRRLENKKPPGLSFTLNNVLTRPVQVYFTDQTPETDRPDLLIHFHGPAYIADHAVYHMQKTFIAAVINLGAGSSVYEKPFQNKPAFPDLIATIVTSVSEKTSRKLKPERIYLSSFSAGYGAVRAILRDHLPEIDGIILLDSLHTGYIPPRRVLAKGGALDDQKLKDFLQFARLAKDGKKQFLITHSEIFPGTYASTTETADFILDALALPRNPVVRWGPGGMQLLSETRAADLTILGFAGNTAPDHIDHLHNLPSFLNMMLDEQPL